MTRTIKPPYQLIEFSGGGLTLGGYAQLKGFLPPVTLLTSIGGLSLGGRTSALTPVGDRGGLRIGGRARVVSLVGQYSPALARFGSTSGMTAVVNSPNSQGSQYLPDIGFPFPLYGSTYQSNIAISSNWALLFGFNLLAATDISRTVPGQAFLIAASRLRSWDRVLVKSDNSFSYRIRFETQIGFGFRPVYNTFEVTLYSDGSIQLVCGTSFDFYGYFGAPRVRSLTKGDNVSYADFNIPSGYYDSYPDTDSVSAGVDASFVFTPDDTAANSHTVRVGSYPVLAPKISRGGLILGGQAIAVPNLATSTPRSYGGLRLGGRSTVLTPPSSIGGLRLGGRSTVTPVFAFSTAISTLQDSTAMTQVVSSYADDASQYLPDIGFNFPIYGSSYRSNIAIGSNWYLLFGLTSIAYSGLSRTAPGRGLLFGADDRSWENVYFKPESGFCRIRFEGHVTSNGDSYTAIFQIKLFLDGTIELTIGIGCFYNSLSGAVRTLTKGDGTTYTDFTVPAGSTAQTDFTSTAVLTSLVFSPVDEIGSSHTVQTGSYSSNTPGTASSLASKGGLRVGGRAIVGTAINSLQSFGGLRLGGIARSTYPNASIGGLRLGGRSSVTTTGQRDTALSNAISYAALNNADYSYYDSVDQMPQLYDGDLSKGMMGLPLNGMVFVQVQLSASSFLNKITLYLGQFNGVFNMPDAIKIYSGLVTASTTDTPIYSGSLTATGLAQDVDLTAVTALNSPFTQITIALIRAGQGYSTVAVNEMQLKGHSA